MILVVNAGSSSLKLAVFDADLTLSLTAAVSEIGDDGRLTIAGTTTPLHCHNHAEALAALLHGLEPHGVTPRNLRAAGHRVVHGGPGLTAPHILTPAIIAEIEACAALAPLHNPPALAAIRALATIAPKLRQTVSFDTAFHATNPPEATRFALPDIPATVGLRRYGFHGLSYASLTRALPTLTGQPLPPRLLAFHLGNGASACAIVNGRSICTTMGYSPLDGLTMGTRPGSIDPNAVLTLAERIGTEPARALLNRGSGLFGLSGGISDMQVLLSDGSETARFAVDHFCYWAVRHAGSLIAAMGGLDAIAFTGGIGEHAAPVRQRICDGLAWCRVPVWIVPAAEERQIAADALDLLARI